mgnify:CR=1 FL=1
MDFPEDLFYPVSVGTIGLFVKKGVPHNYDNDKVYFARAVKDGFAKKKGVRKESSRVRNILKEIASELTAHIKGEAVDIENVAELKKLSLLDKNDTSCELAAEAYLDSRILPTSEIEKGVDEMVREAVAFEIRFNDKLQN